MPPFLTPERRRILTFVRRRCRRDGRGRAAQILELGETMTYLVGLLAIFAAFEETDGRPEKVRRDRATYGVGIAGNCCTHGAGLCAMFQGREDTRVVAGFEPDPRRAGELRRVLGRELAGSFDAVITDPRVDIVAITCEPFRKAEIVEKAARAGKAIFLNKPPCDSLDAARRIREAVRKYEVVLIHDIPMVRSVPVLARLLEEHRRAPRAHGKVLGYHHLFGMDFDPAFDLKAIWPERLEPAARTGGGEMTNMGCYAIDFAVAMFGPPRTVSAKWRKEWDVYRAADVENFGQIVLDYGAFFAFLEVGKQQLTGDRRHANAITINYEHRTLRIDAGARQAALNHVPLDWDAFARGAEGTGSADRLVRSLRDPRQAGDDLDGIVNATEVLMAAYESVVRGGRPVDLPLLRGDNPLTRPGIDCASPPGR